MSKHKTTDLKRDVEKFLEERGAYKSGVAQPLSGFEKAIKGCHPQDVMKSTESVIVFAIHVGLDYYKTLKIKGKTAADDRIGYIYRDWLAYELAEFLKNKDRDAIVPMGHFNQEKKIARLSYKLAAYEAGIGVYGKSGLIITPEYGPRVNIGTVLTDAALEPDEKLEFNPCRGCSVCATVCPAKAIRDKIGPPMSHEREKCISFVQRIRNRTGDDKFFCGYCYDQCPIGRTGKGFSYSRYRRLADLKRKERESLLKEICVQGSYSA